MVYVKWIPKKLADGSVKRYPYKYRSFRNRSGKVETEYLGPAAGVMPVSGSSVISRVTQNKAEKKD